ncbi:MULTISPECIES: hypothetical protein [unclassified Streptomyces]|uniref:hypothetical protein n=1 Tax=unclassified Streptomyces TaxID=2593676 RepID=UPI003D70BCB4
MNSGTPLSLPLEPFLAWAEHRGTPLDPHAADAVTGLLALSTGHRRTGLPEPTEPLAEELLHILLPLYAGAAPAELPGYVDVLLALVDHTREKGRLNAKRQARLAARVRELADGFTEAMTAPGRTTWPRLYAGLMRAEGVDTGDADAVCGWLESFAARPSAERAAALGFSVRATAGGPAASGAWKQALAGERTRRARSELAARLHLVALDERGRSHPGQGPLLPGAPLGAPDGTDREEDWYETQAAVVSDRWTAAGLDALMRGPFAHLAPGGRHTAPLLGVAASLAQEHLECFGEDPDPLAPVPLPESLDALASALRAAPLVQSLTAALDRPEAADEPLVRLALAVGLLLESPDTPDGALIEGPAAVVLREGAPGELAGLGLDLLGSLLAQLAEDEETAEEYRGEHLSKLYFLYQEAGTAQSVARQAALQDAWIVPPSYAPATAVRTPASGPYELPDPETLSALTGLPGLTEDDRAELRPVAAVLARVIDRLAGLGVTERTGDSFTLTPLGHALLREGLLLGTANLPDVDPDTFPTEEAVRAWDGGRLVAAAQWWPSGAARKTLGDWLSGRGADGWSELLAALADTPAGPDAARRRALLGLLDAAAAPVPAWETLLDDPALGEHAAHTLRALGHRADSTRVPEAARATYLADRFEEIRLAAALTHRMAVRLDAADDGDGEGAQSPERNAALCAAFDEAAAGWPGGGQALVAALAVADPYATPPVLEELSGHHDATVAEEARRALRALRAEAHARPTGRAKGAKTASRGRPQAGKRSKKKRKRN